MSLPLSRPYRCRFGAPVLDRVDPRVFRVTYFAACMDCTFCHDACCQFGADIDLTRVAAIDRHRAELEAYLGVPRSEWFREDPADHGVKHEPDYPGGAYTRTQVVDLSPGRVFPNEGMCIFLDPAGRGCRLHRFALERGIEVQEIKPLICLFFPASFREGLLTLAEELDEPSELVCQGSGASVYRGARPELLKYFGPELVAELDALERAGIPAGRTIELPLASPS